MPPATFLSRLRPRTIPQALALLLALVVGPLLVGAFILVGLQAAEDNRLSKARLGAVAQALVAAADAELARGLAQLEVLAASPTLDAGDWQAMRQFALDVTAKVPGSLVVGVGPTGQVLFNTAVPWGEPLPNLWQLANEKREVLWQGRVLPLSSQDLSRRAFTERRVMYSDLYYGAQIHRPALGMALPVIRQGEVKYALIMSFPPEVLRELLKPTLTIPQARALVVDRNGLVVATNGATRSLPGDRVPAVKRDEGAMLGDYNVMARDGEQVQGTYAVSPQNGFIVLVGQPTSASWLSGPRRTWVGWLALVLAVMAVSVAVATVFARRLTRPLQALGQDAMAGRVPQNAQPTGIAEIDALAEKLHFAAQADRQRQQEQLLRVLAQDREAELRKADQQKDEFLAILAHELRNPLAPILTSVELMAKRGLRDPVLERARSIIERQTRHLTRLVDDLLDISRITLGRIQLRLQPVPLGQVVRDTLETLTPTAERNGLALAVQVGQPDLVVSGDPTRLVQCLTNVVGNALKFTPAGGRVRVELRAEGERAVIEVHDTGRGIEPQNLERIFDLFVQETSSGSQGSAGLGIGLPLTRRLLEMHGGAITVASEGPGLGSTFRIVLPLAQAGPPEAGGAPAAGADAPPSPAEQV